MKELTNPKAPYLVAYTDGSLITHSDVNYSGIASLVLNLKTTPIEDPDIFRCELHGLSTPDYFIYQQNATTTPSIKMGDSEEQEKFESEPEIRKYEWYGPEHFLHHSQNIDDVSTHDSGYAEVRAASEVLKLIALWDGYSVGGGTVAIVPEV